MNETISVIVPVYNVEAYLPECLDSICSQSYRDLEILVVDDGSTDHSGEICDAYAAKDDRIRVVHQKNSGAAGAKNTALRMASGTFLTFADSDDWVEPDAYEFMLRTLTAHQADVIQCAHQKMFRDHEILYAHGTEPLSLSPEEFLSRLTTDWKGSLLWNKLYRRELFTGIFFEEGHKIDDEYFTYQGMMRAEKILLSPHVVYHYRMRKSSVMTSHSSREQILLDRLDVLQKRRKRVLSQYPALKAAYDDHYANALLILFRDPSATPESIRRARKDTQAFLAERPAPDIRLRMKLQLFRAAHHRAGKMPESSENHDLSMYFD